MAQRQPVEFHDPEWKPETSTTAGGTTFLPARDPETTDLGIAVTLFDNMPRSQCARVLTYLAMRYGVNINITPVEDK